MKTFSSRLSFSITVAGALLGVVGLLLPSAFRAAGAQASAATQPPQPPSISSSDTQSSESVPERMRPAVGHDPFVPDDARIAAQATTSGMVLMSGMPPGDLPAGIRFIALAPPPHTATHASESVPDGIKGIVVGDHPYALVETDGKTRLLTVGDTFKGQKIANIALRGVTFDDHSIAHIPLLDQ